MRGALDVLDAEIDDVAIAAGRRVVGRRLVRDFWQLGAERIQEGDRRAGALRPAPEAAEVGEIADAPALLRSQRIDLDGPSPRAFGGRGARFVRHVGSRKRWWVVCGGAHRGQDRLL